MKKLIIAALILLILVIAGRFAYDRYMNQQPPLSAEEIKSGQDNCVRRFSEAQQFVANKARGNRTTEARLFFSPSARACIMTYLMINPNLPEPETYNSFIIYNFDKSERLYENGDKAIITYQDYLDRISELEH